MATIEDFQKLDIRAGEIVCVKDFPEARKPAYMLNIDFGPVIGIRQSSAQLTKHYTKEDLVNKKVLGVVNFPPRQIGTFLSEVLILGVPDREGDCVLIVPDKDIPVGGKLY